jgi:hypothetical protein
MQGELSERWCQVKLRGKSKLVGFGPFWLPRLRHAKRVARSRMVGGDRLELPTSTV